MRAVGVETGFRLPAADDSEATEADNDWSTLLLRTAQSIKFQTDRPGHRPSREQEMIWPPNPTYIASVLLRLDPELRHVPTQEVLLNFLRHPFTEESCRRLDEALPALAGVYRALAGTQSSWEAVRLASLIDTPTTAFMPVAGIGRRELPLAPLLHQDPTPTDRLGVFVCGFHAVVVFHRAAWPHAAAYPTRCQLVGHHRPGGGRRAARPVEPTDAFSA